LLLVFEFDDPLGVAPDRFGCTFEHLADDAHRYG
jgi:hypothetical protein